MTGPTTIYRSRSDDPDSNRLIDLLLANWENGIHDDLERIIPSDCSGTLVLDLVCREIELRVQHRIGVNINGFIARFPAMAGSGDLQLHLLEAEILARKNHGPPPTVEEYATQFPLLRQNIEALILPQLTETLPMSPMGYELRSVLGQGGMGTVYRARDVEMNREVAVKILRDKFDPNSSISSRFYEEAQITGQLQHPGIPAVYRVGTTPDGRPYLAMKLIKGETLKELQIRNAPLNVLTIFEAICQAVGYAHSRSVIHRDLKPDNIMVGAFGEVQVMDWGLSKVLSDSMLVTSETPCEPAMAATEIKSLRDSDGSFTLAGSVLGTPAYMAPEQAAGEQGKIDCRSDVFGLGAILCTVLTGHPPFGGKDANSVRVNALRGNTVEAFARLDSCVAEPELVAICKKCLSFEPAERPADGTEVAKEVAQLRSAAEERARRAELDKVKSEIHAEVERKRRRSRLASIVLVLSICFVSLFVVRNRYRSLARQSEVESAVESLATADTNQVLSLLDRLAGMGEDPLPLITSKLSTAETDSPRALHLMLALLPHDESQLLALKKRIPNATPSEFQLLANRLRPHRQSLVPELRQELSSGGITGNHRLRVACLSAQYDSENPEWPAVANVVVDSLIANGANDLTIWTRLLKPVHMHLRSAIDASVIAESQGDRSVAASVFAELPPERADILRMSLRCSPAQIGELLPIIQRHADSFRMELHTALEYPIPLKLPGHFGDWQHDQMAPAHAVRARAALILLLLGDDELAWAKLRSQSSSQTRSYAIDWFHSAKFPLPRLLDRFRIETNDAVRQGILYGIGEYPMAAFTDTEWKRFQAELIRQFETEPDSGLHSAIEWILRRWKCDEAINAAIRRLGKTEPTVQSNWFVNRSGQTFAILRGLPNAMLGSKPEEFGRDTQFGGEELRSVRIERDFAIGTTEVTIEQFRRFAPEFVSCVPGYGYGPSPDCPVGQMLPHVARQYCRWLTEQEGLPESEQCYPNAEVARLKGISVYPDALLRRGYRLPTEAEWEYACRAGCEESRHWGEDHGTLLDKYVVSARIDTDRTYPVWERKANAFGLFDTLGNVWEWCEGYYSHVRCGPPHFANPDWGGPLRNTDNFGIIRGGAFTVRAMEIRSAKRRKLPLEPDSYGDMGFRIVRTVRVPMKGWNVKLFTGDLTIAPSPEKWKQIISQPPVRIARMKELAFWYLDNGQDDDFGLTAETMHEGETGDYTISILSDDGVRMKVSGDIVIERWGANSDDWIVKTVHLKNGARLEVEYWQGKQLARLEVRIDPVKRK